MVKGLPAKTRHRSTFGMVKRELNSLCLRSYTSHVIEAISQNSDQDTQSKISGEVGKRADFADNEHLFRKNVAKAFIKHGSQMQVEALHQDLQVTQKIAENLYSNVDKGCEPLLHNDWASFMRYTINGSCSPQQASILFLSASEH